MPACPPAPPPVFVRPVRAPLPAPPTLPRLGAIPCAQALCFDAAGRRALLDGVGALERDDAMVRERYGLGE